ncbi:MAG: chloride channel protein [Bacteroidota bacterium]
MKKASVIWKHFIKVYENQANKKVFVYLLSILVGLVTGIAVVILKNTTAWIEEFVDQLNESSTFELLYLFFPALGIVLTVMVIRLIIRKHVGHDGIPRILYAISRREGLVESHNIFSSAITSALTVGFGGSVGLEGPVVTTGGSIGSNLGRMFRLNRRQRILLIGSATAAAISAIFEAPIAGIVFALEVMMIDLTTASLIPISLASITGSLVSIFITGENVLYTYIDAGEEHLTFLLVLYYIFLGVLTGLLAVYFSKSYSLTVSFFNKFKKKRVKFLFGILSLGILIYLFPSLYGEGYQSINQALSQNYDFLFANSFLHNLPREGWIVILLLFVLSLIKVFATTITFEAGGIGGIFAPTMFMGAMFGLALALLINKTGIIEVNPASSILVGMAGLLASIIQAPLTGIFLISELTHGYNLMLPLMISSIVSFTIVRIFHTNSVYTKQLAKRGDLLTHHADKNALTLMNIEDLIEKNFKELSPSDSLKKLVEIISDSKRNVYPVIDNERNLLGIITLDNVRKVMFQQQYYDKVLVEELMFVPEVVLHNTDSMETVAEKIQKSGKFNVAVLDESGKYLGFVSRANVFSTYRSLLREFSAD